MANTKPSWPSAVVALGFIALVGVMFWRATEGDFATIWAGVGTIVGVVTGAIPSFFFKTQADAATATADVTAKQAVALAGVAEPASVQALIQARPELFSGPGAPVTSDTPGE